MVRLATSDWPSLRYFASQVELSTAQILPNKTKIKRMTITRPSPPPP